MNVMIATPKLINIPPIRMSRQAHCRIMSTIGARRPETGGILLGPIDCEDITNFFFDVSASCSDATYTPDSSNLKDKLDQAWMPAGLDMKGFVHSHPRGFEQLSAGDMEYIGRLLKKNPDMRSFAAPLVFPDKFQLRAMVVLADQPTIQRRTTLELF